MFRVALVVLLALVFFASNAHATADWSVWKSRVATYVPDATGQSPTIYTGMCFGGVGVQIFGATLTAMPQICSQPALYGAADPDVLVCQDLNIASEKLDGASTTLTGRTYSPGVPWLRLADITNNGGGQFVLVYCAGGLR